MNVEGVTYYPYTIRFTTAHGKRVVWTRWAPYEGALANSLRRELDNAFTDAEMRGVRITVERKKTGKNATKAKRKSR